MKLKPIIFLLCCGIFSIGAADDSFEALREQAINRKRTVIYNTDGCDITYFPKDMKLTKESFLSRRINNTIGSDVDTISYCALSTSLCSYACKLDSVEFIDIQGAWEVHVPNTRHIAPELDAMGTSALAIVEEHCRKHNKEFFISIRMNDTHDVVGTLEKPHWMMTKFKLNNPDAIFGSSAFGKRPPFCSWTAYDYENPKVRQLLKNAVKELLEKYDVDGIEFDFMRHAQLLKTVGWGAHATQAQLDLLTNYVKELRSIIDEAGKKRNRPVLVAIRVPDSIGYCRAIGIDLEKWLESGFADILITSSYFQLNPWKTSVDLAKKYNVKFYASLDESRILEKNLPIPNRNSDDSYYARISRVMASGADGVYFFNKEGQGVKKVMTTNPERVQAHNKVYYLRVRGSGGYQPDHYVRYGSTFDNLPDLEPHNPKLITDKQNYNFNLFIGDDLTLPAVKKLNPEVTAFFSGKAPESAKVFLTVNGKKFPALKNNKVFSVQIPAELIKKGDNAFVISLDGNSQFPMFQSTEIYSGNYHLSGKNQKFWRRLFAYDGKKAELSVNDSCRINDYSNTVSPNFSHPLPKRNGAFAVGFTMQNGENSEKDTAVLRVVSGGKVEVVSFEPNKITFKYANKSIAFNTIDKFHRYLVSSNGKEITLKADGQLILTAPFNSTTKEKGKNLVGASQSTPWMDSDMVLFGSLSREGVGYSDWKNITVADGAVVVDDFALTITFDDGKAEVAKNINDAPKTVLTEITAKDGKLLIDKKIRNRYGKEFLSVEDNKIILDHTSQSKPATFQHFELIHDKWMDNVDTPFVITWRSREIEESTVGDMSFTAATTIKVNGNYYVMVVRHGKDKLSLPWNRQIIVPDSCKVSHEYKAAFDPATGLGAVWLDGKLVGVGEVPIQNHRKNSYITFGDGSAQVAGKVELEYLKIELLQNKVENSDVPSQKKPEEIASISVKDGKVVLKNVRNSYKENPITVSDNTILLDHTSTEKPATFQHFEMLIDNYLKNLIQPIIISWESADLESSENNKGSFQFMCTPNIPNKGYFDFGFSIGHGKIITPWGKEISLPDNPNAMYKYSAEFDPETCFGKLYINNKLISEGKVKNNKSRQRSYFSVGDGSSGISGKVKLRGISVKIINQ